MSRAADIVSVLLEADEFDPRSYLLDPDSKTTELLNEIKAKLQPWYTTVEVFPAVEGTANFPKFFHGGNRYRIRCKRVGPVPPELRGYGPGDAKRMKEDIQRSLQYLADQHGYYVANMEFSGYVYTNLLIVLDMWPLERPHGIPEP